MTDRTVTARPRRNRLLIAEFVSAVMLSLVALVAFAYMIHDVYTLPNHSPLTPHSPWLLRIVIALVVFVAAAAGVVISGACVHREIDKQMRAAARSAAAACEDESMSSQGDGEVTHPRSEGNRDDYYLSRRAIWRALSVRRRVAAVLWVPFSIFCGVVGAKAIGSGIRIISPFHPLVDVLVGVSVVVMLNSDHAGFGIKAQWRQEIQKRSWEVRRAEHDRQRESYHGSPGAE